MLPEANLASSKDEERAAEIWYVHTSYTMLHIVLIFRLWTMNDCVKTYGNTF